MAATTHGDRTSAITARLGMVLAFLTPRAPILLVSAVYGLLLILEPLQVREIVDSGWAERGWIFWLAASVPLLLAAIGHLALIAGRARLHRLGDPLLTNLPLFLLAAMAARWAPEGLLVVMPALAVGVIGSRLLIAPIESRATLAAGMAAVSTVLVFSAAVAAVVSMPIRFPVALGPLTVLTLGLACIGLLLAIAWLRPALAGLYMLVCITGAALTESRPVPLAEPVAERDGGDADDLLLWLRGRPDLADYRNARRPYPVIIASAEGGGIYAAAHSYLTLSSMQQTCPSFAAHLFATVGVSGGGVGNLLYSATVHPTAGRGPLRPCVRRRLSVDLRPVTADLLSPVLANLLLVRAADLLVPFVQLFPEGGEVLAASIQTALPGNPALSAPLYSGWEPTGNRPAMIFVATDVNSGSRFLLSATSLVGAEAESFPTGAISSARDIAVNRAAAISSSFPYLTSTVRLAYSEVGDKVLADGGYVDNSGAETALALIRDIQWRSAQCQQVTDQNPEDTPAHCRCIYSISPRFDADVEWSGCSIPIFIAYMPISNTYNLPGYTYGDEAPPRQAYLTDPVAALVKARELRGVLALLAARRHLGGEASVEMRVQDGDGHPNTGNFEFEIDVEGLNLPLGWKLSAGTAERIRRDLAPSAACFSPRSDAECREGDVLVWLFDPRGWWSQRQ